MKLLGSCAWAIFAPARGTVTIERLGERNHHQTHHHRKRQSPNDHSAFQSFHRIGAGIGLSRHQQCADHRGQNQTPDDLMLVADVLVAA